jgi:peroxiredoxin
VEFVGIGLLDGRSAVEKFVSHYGLTFPNGYDAAMQVAKLYGFTYQPFWAVISKDGMLLHAGYGPSGEQQLVATIKALLQQ